MKAYNLYHAETSDKPITIVHATSLKNMWHYFGQTLTECYGVAVDPKARGYSAKLRRCGACNKPLSGRNDNGRLDRPECADGGCWRRA